MCSLSAHLPAIDRALALVALACQDYLKVLRSFMWPRQKKDGEKSEDNKNPVEWLRQMSWNCPMSLHWIPESAHDYKKLCQKFLETKAKMEKSNAQQG
jgi:hypothetical protein